MRFCSGKSVLCRHLEPFTYLSAKNGSRRTSIRLCYNEKGKIKKKETTLEKMEPKYNPATTENQWYDWWESEDYFKPKNDKKIFTVLLPPPNVTGTLHLGHALTITIQDVFLRWMRMRGENVVWIPGFDHAGIATQVVVENYLQNVLNVTKYDLGRNEFFKKILEWKAERENTIIKQMRQLGASIDWNRKYFTMDNKSSEAVTRAFLHLYDKGLIYRRTSLVNWSCYLRSAVSDIEIKWEEVRQPTKINVPGYKKPVQFGYMYNIAYRVWNDGADGEEVVVGTTRPETMLGDTAIAFHPNDVRYTHLRNKFVWHPIRKCKIPIIFDEHVNPEIGTGALKVTPSHSLDDFEIYKRNNLEILDVFDENGLVRKIEPFSNFGGLKRFDVREKILNELQNLRLYRGKSSHSTTVPLCIRSGDVIEYLTKPQWYIKCKEMYEKVILAISRGEVIIEPEHCKNILFEWFRHDRDWNLSRQIWWGHQIPMFECETGDGKVWVGATSEEEAKLLMAKKLKENPENLKVTRDPDVLDTWFSSGILPFSLCGWPKQLSAHYPLGLMETGCDIIFFWVARMLMLGIEITGQVPFPKVVLHGLICDNYGKKMSKSSGNVILPEYVINGVSLEKMRADLEKSYANGAFSASELKHSIEGQKKMFPTGIPECGTDALRLGLCSNIIKADQINFDIKAVKSNHQFCNKMWQTMIYLIRSIRNKSDLTAQMPESNLSLMDEWILSRLSNAVELVNRGISDFQYHIAVEAMRIFFINEFCSVYLESTKLVFNSGSEEDSRRAVAILFNCLETSFRLLSPFMPFVTEELYHYLPKLNGFTPYNSITLAEFPDPKLWSQFSNSKVNDFVSNCLDIIHSIRQSRSLYKLSSRKLKVVLACPPDLERIFSDELTIIIKGLAGLEEFSPVNEHVSESNVIIKYVGDCTVYLYHEHTKSSLKEIFSSLLWEENELRKCFDVLKLSMSDPDYENVTPVNVKNKNFNLMCNLAEKLKKIDEVKNVIERAQ